MGPSEMVLGETVLCEMAQLWLIRERRYFDSTLICRVDQYNATKTQIKVIQRLMQ